MNIMRVFISFLLPFFIPTQDLAVAFATVLKEASGVVLEAARSATDRAAARAILRTCLNKGYLLHPYLCFSPSL
jgi:hypothetical protein